MFFVLTLRLLNILSRYFMRNFLFMRHWRPPKGIFLIILAWSLIVTLKARLYLICFITPRICWTSFRIDLMVQHWPLHVTTYLPEIKIRLNWSPKNNKFSISMLPNYYTYPSKHDLISKLPCLTYAPESRILIYIIWRNKYGQWHICNLHRGYPSHWNEMKY